MIPDKFEVWSYIVKTPEGGGYISSSLEDLSSREAKNLSRFPKKITLGSRLNLRQRYVKLEDTVREDIHPCDVRNRDLLRELISHLGYDMTEINERKVTYIKQD